MSEKNHFPTSPVENVENSKCALTIHTPGVPVPVLPPAIGPPPEEPGLLEENIVNKPLSIHQQNTTQVENVVKNSNCELPIPILTPGGPVPVLPPAIGPRPEEPGLLKQKDAYKPLPWQSLPSHPFSPEPTPVDPTVFQRRFSQQRAANWPLPHQQPLYSPPVSPGATQPVYFPIQAMTFQRTFPRQEFVIYQPPPPIQQVEEMSLPCILRPLQFFYDFGCLSQRQTNSEEQPQLAHNPVPGPLVSSTTTTMTPPLHPQAVNLPSVEKGVVNNPLYMPEEQLPSHPTPQTVVAVLPPATNPINLTEEPPNFVENRDDKPLHFKQEEEETDDIPYTAIDMNDSSGEEELEITSTQVDDTEKLIITKIDFPQEEDEHVEGNVVVTEPPQHAHADSKKKNTTKIKVLKKLKKVKAVFNKSLQQTPAQVEDGKVIVKENKATLDVTEPLQQTPAVDDGKKQNSTPPPKDYSINEPLQCTPASLGNGSISSETEDTAIIKEEKLAEGDEQKNVTPKLTLEQKQIRDDIINDLFEEVHRAVVQGVEIEDNYTETCCDLCSRSCCESLTCNISTPTNCRFERPKVSRKVVLTKTLLLGINIGRKRLLKKFFLKLVPAIMKYVWVTLEFITVLIGLILSIVTVSLDQNQFFNILHLFLIIVSGILAIIDAVGTSKEWILECLSKKDKSKDETKDKAKDETKDKAKDDAKEETKTKTCKNECCSCCQNLFDVLRILLSELILYPLLICDFFEIITGRGYQGDSHGDRLGFALFLLSCFSLVLYVYIARIIVLALKLKSISAGHPSIEGTEPQKNYDPEIRSSAKWYLLAFFVHVLLQMIAQIMLYIAIAGKIRYDNRHFYETGNTDLSVRASGYLWCMMLIGGVTPFLGYLSFFIVTSYWAQEFPIGYCIDMLKFMKSSTCGPDDYVNLLKKFKVMDKNMFHESFDKSITNLIKNLVKDFKPLQKASWCDKFLHPFKSPPLVVVCIIYAVLQLTFVICAGLAVNDMGDIMGQILNGGGWIAYYTIAIIVGAIANIYVFLVAGLWISIVVAVIMIVAYIILFYMFISCIANTNTSTRTYPHT